MSLTLDERITRLLETLPHEACDADCPHPCPTMANTLMDARECLQAQQARLAEAVATMEQAGRCLALSNTGPADALKVLRAFLRPADSAEPCQHDPDPSDPFGECRKCGVAVAAPAECEHNWWPSAYDSKRVVQKTCAKCGATVTVPPVSASLEQKP